MRIKTEEELRDENIELKFKINAIKKLVKGWNYLSDLEAREDILSIIEDKEDE